MTTSLGDQEATVVVVEPRTTLPALVPKPLP
jgi:hypothetical protein